MIQKTITIDLWREYRQPLNLVQYEAEGRTLNITLINGGQVVDLTSAAVTFNMTKGTNIIYNACTITDASAGKISLLITGAVCDTAGTFDTFIEIVKTDDVLRSQNFDVTVKASANNTGAVEATSEFTALEMALAEVVGFENLKSGWSTVSDTWAYSSAVNITVPSGAANIYKKGDKIRLKQGGDFKYFSVIGVTDTVLSVTGGDDYVIANSAITDVYCSKQENPHGFPPYFNYTVSVDAGSGAYSNATCACKFKVTGELVYLRAQLDIIDNGTAATYTRFVLPVACVDAEYPHIIMGREDLATGNLVYGQVYSSYCIIVKADGTYAGSTGYGFGLNGSYLMA